MVFHLHPMPPTPTQSNPMKNTSLILLSICILSGCASVKYDDVNRSNLHTTLQPAVFKPEVEVIAQELVKGTAEKEKIWFFTTKSPNSYVRDTGSSFHFMGSSLEAAAMYDACQKKPGTTIILAPRFTETRERSGFLGLVAHVTVTVEGIPARVVGAHEVDINVMRTNLPCCRQALTHDNASLR